jgi:hypothetical protein
MGGGKGSSPAASPYEDAAAKMAKELYAQTDPLRQSLLGDLSSVAAGTYNPESSATYAPLYATARSGAEAQYGVAKENILANTPRGGGQVDALANLESARAADVGEIPGMLSNQIIQDMMAKAYGTAFGAPQQSMAGMNSVAGTYGNRAAQANAAASQQTSSLYGGLGMLGGMALGGPGGALGGKSAGKSLGGK